MKNNFNFIERNIAKFLSRTPYFKKNIKKSYQRINYHIYKKKYRFKSNFKIDNCAHKNFDTFFGYYDKSPINSKNQFIIYHSSELNTQNLPNSEIPIQIVLYNLLKNKVVKTFMTHSYNWQQGAKLQWIDDKRFIYNDYDKQKDRYISKIVNTDKIDVEKALDYPIYDVYNDFSLTLNFDRLNILRPDYGYRNRKENINFSNNKNEGIFYIDLKNNASKLIISFDNVIKLHYKENMENAKHWFNHIMISPNGDKFMFLHRWLDGNRKFDALIISDINGNNVKCLADDDMVSHCFWNGNSKIISFMRDKNLGDNYYLINIKSNKRKILGKGIIDKFGDGHPSIYKNMMLFDTYPNKARMKELYLFNMDDKRLIKLGEFFESLKYYEETRCDLHPRWSPDGKKIFFDSVHSGKRFLYSIDWK
ncbi:MAG: glycosyl transferase [Candidatus Cloacimonetes bacterium]|nr:glycosyl transferase [Candidatus Cloacimonadota bacterium]